MARKRYDIDEARYSTDLNSYLERWSTRFDGSIFVLHPSQSIPFRSSKGNVDCIKLQPAMDRARVIKDEHEVALIRKANSVTAEAHSKVLRKIRHLKNEAEVEALFLQTCIAGNAKHQAYDIIAAAGPNASTLHYVANDSPLEGRALMVLDAGCEWHNYASDVTRTIPLRLSSSGSWPTKETQEIHDLVDCIQHHCISRLKPGVQFIHVHVEAQIMVIEGLLKLGILRNGTVGEILSSGTGGAFFPHGLGHHMGLEVHDVSGVPSAPTSEGTFIDLGFLSGSGLYHGLEHGVVPFESAVVPEFAFLPVSTAPEAQGLRPGMVITVEPGM